MSNIKTYMYFGLIGFIIVSVFGTLSHFFYQWSGNNKIVGLFFPVNESTWEHLKLAIFPTIIYFLIGLNFIKNQNYLFSFFITLLIPIILIPLIFYSYTAITKSPILIVDIITYYFSVLVAFLVCFKVLSSPPLHTSFNIIAVIGISLILICYFSFTYYPPKNFLFKDAVTGGYGFLK